MERWLSLFLMIIVIYSVRMLPMILLRRNITNVWVRSFLHYVPYVTLAVMTFPAIIHATDTVAAGTAALVTGLIVAWVSGDLFTVSVCCCVSALITSMIL